MKSGQPKNVIDFKRNFEKVFLTIYSANIVPADGLSPFGFKVILGSSNGLVLIRQRAIMWNNNAQIFYAI